MKRNNLNKPSGFQIIIMRCCQPGNSFLKTAILLYFFVIVFAQNSSLYAQNELARLGFLQFTNVKGSDDIAYLGGSISDALAKSMQAKFQYNAIPAIQIESSTLKTIEIRKKGPNKEPEKGAFLPMQLSELANIAKETKADILVLGEYDSVGNNVAVIVTTRIYFASINNITAFKPEQYPIDGSLFGALDIMADSLVGKIAEIMTEKSTVAESKNQDIEVSEDKKHVKIALTMTKVTQNMERLNFIIKNPSSIPISVVGDNITPGCNFAFSSNGLEAVAWPCGNKIIFLDHAFVKANHDTLIETRNYTDYLMIANLDKIMEKIKTTSYLRLKENEQPMDVNIFPGIMHLPEQDTLILYTSVPKLVPLGIGNDTTGIEFAANGLTREYILTNGNLGLGNLLVAVGIPATVLGAIISAPGFIYGNSLALILGLMATVAGITSTTVGFAILPGMVAVEKKL